MGAKQGGRHMRDAGGSPSLAWWPAIAVVLALLLEAGTILGAPALSLADPSSWKPARMVVFFVLALYPAWRLARVVAEGVSVAGLRARLDEEGMTPAQLRASGIALASSCVGGYVAQQVVAALRGVDDVRCGIFAAALLAVGSLLVVNRRLHRAYPEWGYLSIALALGIATCALMPVPAMISFDGATHFNTAQAMSYVVDAEYTDADRIMTWGGYQTGAFAGLEMEVEPDVLEVDLGAMTGVYPHVDQGHGALVRANEILDAAEGSGNITILEGVERLGGSYVSARSLGLIPNAAGLWLGRLLHLPSHARFLVGRLANTLLYVTVMFMAMRRLRHGKLIVAAIALIPVSVLLAANYSYDPWHTAFITYSMARFVGLLQEGEGIRARDAAAVAIPFVIGAAVKPVVFPLGLVFLLMPGARFASERDARGYRLVSLALVLIPALVILVPVALLLVLGDSATEYVSAIISADGRGGALVDAVGQLRYVLTHLPQTLRMVGIMMLRMMGPARSALALTASDENLTYFFPYLVPAAAPLTELVAASCAILLAASALLDRGEEDASYAGIAFKLVPLVAFALGFFNIAMALYVSYTDVGRDVIGGVQYRYLIPLVVPVLLMTLNFRPLRSRAGERLATAFLAAEAVLGALVLVNSFAIWL